ncbi:MAG TPA: hypothetical protein VEC19_19100 [Usitatibacter sp.]|nr:hypothetical protein [Usitatibacter sp.]
MADVYAIKDGTPHLASAPHRFPIETVAAKLTPFEKRYFDAPPDINPAHGPSSRDAPFRHVIVKVGDTETNAVFPDEGWYHVPHLTAEDCEALFGVRFK